MAQKSKVNTSKQNTTILNTAKKDTTLSNSTATDVMNSLAQYINAAVPSGGDYGYTPIASMQPGNPTLMNSSELARLYGLDYNLDNMKATLQKEVDAGYDARYNQQGQAERKYYSNAATAQSTLADTLRKQQSQAIMTGTNKGMQAAQALSAMMGTSQQFAGEATQLAMDRQQIGKEQASDQARVGVNAMNAYNQMGQQLADVSKTVYSADTSKYVGELDYNAAAATSNAQLQAQSMASKSQWESTYANAVSNAYRDYYNGQISLEQAKMQADAAVQSAKVYGLDAAKITSEANKQIADTNAGATRYAAGINYSATKYAADASANATRDAANASASSYSSNQDAARKNTTANLVTGLIAGINTGTMDTITALQTLKGYVAAGLVGQDVYDSTRSLLGGNKLDGIKIPEAVPAGGKLPMFPTYSETYGIPSHPGVGLVTDPKLQKTMVPMPSVAK